MINNCPVCGKAFDVLWPHLWRYKIGNNYFCRWTCFRAAETGKKEIVMKKSAQPRARMTREEMDTAMQIWRDGGDIDAYLKAHGITNIAKWKMNAKNRRPAEVPAEDPVRQQLPEENKAQVAEIPEKQIGGLCPPPDETERSCRVTALDTPIGEFHYDRRNGYLDWDWDNNTMSLKLEEWKEFRKWFPYALKLLEVEE